MSFAKDCGSENGIRLQIQLPHTGTSELVCVERTWMARMKFKDLPTPKAALHFRSEREEGEVFSFSLQILTLSRHLLQNCGRCTGPSRLE